MKRNSDIFKKKKIDFIMRSKEYQRLHLLLYFMSVLLIVFIYFLIIMLFSQYSKSVVITSVISLFVGVYLVLNRDKLVLKIGEFLQEIERKKIKKRNKVGLKKTISKLRPKKRRIKLNIKDKTPIKEKIKNLTKKIKRKKSKKEEYIEIK